MQINEEWLKINNEKVNFSQCVINQQSHSLSANYGLISPAGPKVGVSNERFSAKVKLRCKLDIHIALLSPPVYLRRRVRLQCFQGVT